MDRLNAVARQEIQMRLDAAQAPVIARLLRFDALFPTDAQNWDHGSENVPEELHAASRAALVEEAKLYAQDVVDTGNRST